MKQAPQKTSKYQFSAKSVLGFESYEHLKFRPTRRRAWKIRKRCQGSGSPAKYVAAKRVHEDRLETGGAGKEFSANTEIQRLEPEW